jgi:TetR/AcrR family transcriptional regulator
MAKKKKRMSGEERKAQIVKVASRLFSRKGFKGTSTREIAKRARISEATIFKHFSRKEALYSAIIDRCCNDNEGRLLLMKSIEGKAGRELFKGVAAFFIERYREDPSFARLLMFSALEGRMFSDIFMKSKGMETVDSLSGHIKGLIRAGHFKRRDPTLSARAFLGMVFHYCMVQEIYGFKRFFDRPPEVVAETFVDIFINGMKKEPRP